jgi:hypothetical protein
LFKEAVLQLPRKIAGESIKDKGRSEQLETSIEMGMGVDLISLADDKVFVPRRDDPEWTAFDSALETRSRGREISGSRFLENKKMPLSKGMTLVFGYGVHALDERRLRGEDGLTAPSDITIKGAGMDATLLQLGDISIRGNVERLAISDLTLDCGDDGLFDLRSGSLLLDLNKVRIVRFDAAHGGCTIFDSEGLLVRAHNCKFVGGYGRSPGHGRLLRSGPPLARFIGCHFELIDLNLKRAGIKGRIAFEYCTFNLLYENPLEQEYPIAEFISCDFDTLLDRRTPREELQKDLTDLFPQLEGR